MTARASRGGPLLLPADPPRALGPRPQAPTEGGDRLGASPRGLAGPPPRASRGVRAVPPHGTRARYCSRDRCRCAPCREANLAYATVLRHAQTRPDGDWTPAYRDASEAREHLLWLSTVGVGKRTVHARTRIAISTIDRIRSGEIERCRPATIAKILAVNGADAVNGARVPSGPTSKLVDELLREGFTRTRIARELGSKAKTPALQISRSGWVSARNARKVREVHARLMARALAEREMQARRQRKYRAEKVA